MIRTKALVIKEHIVGESDKYITLFTKELGRIQAIAPKAKKADKGFASSTQLFVYGDFMLTSYKDTYRLISVDLIEMFHNIRNDLSTLSYGSYIMEFIYYVTEPGLMQSELLKLTLVTLKALSKQQADCKRIRRVFEIRALGLLGFMPQLYECTHCGTLLAEKEEASYYFSAEAGGILCQGCRGNYIDVTTLGYSTLYTLRYILSIPLKQLYYFKVNEQVQRELDVIGSRYIHYYVDHAFKTLDFINKLEEL